MGCVARPTDSYRPRRPEQSVLYRVVRDHLETFRAQSASIRDGEGLPRFVDEEFRSYLRCGWLAGGFARLRCAACGTDRLVAFSCKGRGFCPSCSARRMAEHTAHMVDHVFPPVAVRQWVLSLPFRIRYLLAWDHDLCRAVVAVFLRTVLGFLRSRARRAGVADGRSGAVAVVQRFGAALNLNVHVHALVVDGVFSRDASGRLAFHEAAPLSDDDVGDHSSGRHGHARRDGFDLHAGVVAPAGHRHRLERLCRYALRPPIAEERLQVTAAEQALLRLRHGWTDGTTHLLFDPLELLERLAVITPRPRVNLILYHGVLAPRAGWRRQVVQASAARESGVSDADAGRVHAADPDAGGGKPMARSDPPNRSWASMMRRVFGYDVLACSRCGQAMRLVALIEQADVLRRWLRPHPWAAWSAPGAVRKKRTACSSHSRWPGNRSGATTWPSGPRSRTSCCRPSA